MPFARTVRPALLVIAAALLLYALVADPTGVGRGRETYFRATLRQVTGADDSARSLAYIVNQYTLAAVGVALASLVFRTSAGPRTR